MLIPWCERPIDITPDWSYVANSPRPYEHEVDDVDEERGNGDYGPQRGRKIRRAATAVLGGSYVIGRRRRREFSGITRVSEFL